MASERPVLPGLRLAIVDEADSILLDEATLPLILAAPGAPVPVDAYGRAMDISRRLQRGRDYQVQSRPRHAALTDAGRAEVARAVEAAGQVLRPVRRAHELVEAALTARLLMARDRDYAVTGGRLQLIDEVTGRIADGRQWTGPLQAMVELKEGLPPSAPSRTAAQITYQRFFPRYLQVSGMSGSLRDARRELHVLYDGRVCRVPLARPDRRRWLGERCFADAARRDAALVDRVRTVAGSGRPVLIGTDSVAASHRVSERLRAAGVAHRVLNAVQDADEAALIAEAGRAGAVTVATNIAGRGTDIRLDEAARAAGGLHVIAAMRNRSRRIDRQLVGRAARHGDPGSAERLLALDDPLLAEHWPLGLRRAVARLARSGELPRPLGTTLAALAQRLAEARDRALRRELRHADRRLDDAYAFAGGTE
jgi:preprotein translocase subunit SecA